MEILILLLLAAVIIAILLQALFLNLTTKIFKIENSKYGTALKISIIDFMATFIISIIITAIVNLVGVGSIGSVVVWILTFSIFYFLLKKYYMARFWKSFFIYIIYAIIIAVVSLITILPIRAFIAEPFYAKGAAMEPAFRDGDYLIINKLDRDYKRGGIVVFKYPKKPDEYFIKRIVGLPGELVEIKEGNVLINNKILDEKEYLDDIQTLRDDSLELGNDEYYVLGDNRTSSLDSRSFGAIKKDSIVGKYWFEGRVIFDLLK